MPGRPRATPPTPAYGQLAQTYHDDVMVKAAGEAHHSEHYIAISDAMARHAAVLNNGVCRADDTHHKLYRHRRS